MRGWDKEHTQGPRAGTFQSWGDSWEHSQEFGSVKCHQSNDPQKCGVCQSSEPQEWREISFYSVRSKARGLVRSTHLTHKTNLVVRWKMDEKDLSLDCLHLKKMYLLRVPKISCFWWLSCHLEHSQLQVCSSVTPKVQPWAGGKTCPWNTGWSHSLHTSSLHRCLGATWRRKDWEFYPWQTMKAVDLDLGGWEGLEIKRKQK